MERVTIWSGATIESRLHACNSIASVVSSLISFWMTHAWVYLNPEISYASGPFRVLPLDSLSLAPSPSHYSAPPLLATLLSHLHLSVSF